MKKLETGLALALCAGAFVAGRATAATPQEEMDMKAMEAAWDEMGKVGKMHEHLKPLAGTWQADCKFWMGPGQPMTSTGTSTNELIFDGRYLKQRFDGDFQGETFTGMGFWGFSNVHDDYQSIWFDSMSTNIVFQDGWTVSDDGKTFTTTGTEKNPMTGQDEDYKDVLQIMAPDKHMYTRYMITDGGEQKSMEIVYTK